MAAKHFPRNNFEEFGDAEAAVGNMTLACRAYVYGHVNGKLRFLLKSSTFENVDLGYDAVVSGNIDAFLFIVRDFKYPFSGKAMVAIFDSGNARTLDSVIDADILKTYQVQDPALVAAVEIEKHIARARCGAVRLNPVFRTWGPPNARHLFELAEMKSEEARSRAHDLGLSPRSLLDSMLFAALAGVKGKVSAIEVARIAKTASAETISELVDFHPYVRFDDRDIRELISKKNIGPVILKIVNHAKNPMIRYVFKSFGLEKLKAFTKYV